MRNYEPSRFGVSRFIAFIILVGAPVLASAELSYWIGDPFFQRNFVLTGDSVNPARDGAAVTQSAMISTTTIEVANYRFAWHLEVQNNNGSWSQVALNGPNTVFSDSEAVGLSTNPDDDLPSGVIITHYGSLHPEQTLDPHASYRVVGQLQRWPLFGDDYHDVEGPKTGSSSNLYHFTNTISDDNARNVISTLHSVTLDNPFLLAGAVDVEKRGFTVNVSVTARRWDAYSEGPLNSPVSFRFEVKLRNASTGTLVPLASSTFDRSRVIPTYSDGATPVPSITNFSETLNLRPLAQLNPVNERYKVEVTIRHIEETIPSQVIKTGNMRDRTDLQVFHFNGALNFSGIGAVIENFTRSPQPATATFGSYVTMTLNDLSGRLASETAYTYQAPAGVSIRLFANGTAVVQSVAATIPVTQPGFFDFGTIGNVRFARGNMTLQASGLHSGLVVLLPQGMGYTSDLQNSRNLIGTLNFSNQALDNQLNPIAAEITFEPDPLVHVVEETKPVAILASKIAWNPAAGSFEIEMPQPGAVEYVRKSETDFLAESNSPPAQRIKSNNSGYYSAINGTGSGSVNITAAADSSARLSTDFIFHDGHFKTHFPHGSDVHFQSGQLRVVNDSVIDGQLDGVDPLTIYYGQGCAEVDCDDGDSARIGRFIIDAPILSFTPDGGLIGSGSLFKAKPTDTVLSWGYIEALSGQESVFSHFLGDFSSATVHMTGHFISGGSGVSSDFLPGGQARERAEAAPGAIHLSAVLGAQNIARPGSAADAAGNHHYAGVNLKTAGEGDVTGTAVIAGEPFIYSLRDCNRFYARRGGVTGTVEAVPGSFPKELEIYNYGFTFDYYGFGFLDSSTSPARSFTAGSLSVKYPSAEIFEFDGLGFTCLGGLDSARLPDGRLTKRLDYWNADIDVATLNFVTSDSCNPAADAFVALGLTAYSTLIDQPLHGVVGIRPNGELIHRDFSRAGNLETEITSRLRLPNRIGLQGPDEETYELTTISEAYFNDHESSSEQASGDGRLNFAVKMDVPFFEDLAVHVRATASKIFDPSTPPHLMGGWTNDEDETYFTSTFFDSANRAFPDDVAEALYRNESSAPGDPSPYLIHARQKWLNVVDFDYPLSWSPTLRSFSAFNPSLGKDLLIVTIDHQLEYLSAENAEISFGVIYDGLPRINLTNFVFNKIKEGTGVLEAVTQALKEEAVGALAGGLDSMETLLNDRVDALLEDFLSQAVDPVINKLYGALHSAVSSGNDWKEEVEAKTKFFLVDNTTPGETADNVRHVIKQLSGTVEDASSLIHKADTSLLNVQLALRAIHGEIYKVDGGVSLHPPAGGPQVTIKGFLSLEDGKFQIVESLVANLIGEVGGALGSELAGMLSSVLDGPVSELNRLINEQLENVRPALERLTDVIAKLDDRIGDARDQLGVAGEFGEELQAILAAAGNQIDNATEELQSAIESILIADIPSSDKFAEFTEEELKQRIRQEIQDKLREMDFLREYQLVLRQRLYDLDLSIKEGIDTAFGQVNIVLKNLLQEYLAQFDDQINGFLGDLGAALGAGKLDGFAHINGDALRLLRLDAYLQLKVPENLEFNGYLQIKQLESDGSGSCSYGAEGTLSKEITMGAFGVPVSWISPGMELDIDGKVTFSESPIGLGGGIEMVRGSIGFEAFTITDLGAAMSFGKTENYLAAKVGLSFQSYSLYGGVFFGQTCSIAPLELVNSHAADVLGAPAPSFSGAYVYGEAHIPISEAFLGIPASCMFKITAGVGAGAFYFVEGPTYGGQILLAASGRALCLVSIKGEVSLVGAKVADDLRFNGRGRLSGRVGSCPFCVRFGKTLKLEYSNDRWSFDL